MTDNQLQEQAGETQVLLDDAFEQADHIIMRKYMSEMSGFPIKEIDADLENRDINNILRLFRVEKIVYDAEENNLDKLLNIYHSVALCGGSVVHIIHSDGEKVEYYIGARSTDMDVLAACKSVLSGTFEGNFPGSKMVLQTKGELKKCIDNIFSSNIWEEHTQKISIVSGIPGLRKEESAEFVQGMEKLIDSMRKQKYTLITIAEPVSMEMMMQMKESYEDLYSQLSPFSRTTQMYSQTDSDAVAKSISEAVTRSVGNTISNTTSNSESTFQSKNKSIGASIGAKLGEIASATVNVSAGTSSGITKQNGTSQGSSESIQNGTSTTTGNTDTHTTASGKTLQLSYENKRVTDLLKQIDRQIQRIEDAKDTGLWNTAAYCLADDIQTSKTLAGTLQSLCRGKKNTIENYSINTWMEDKKLKSLEKYLKKMTHPFLQMRQNDQYLDMTPASMISGDELAVSAGFPQKGVSGVAISKMVPFSRNIIIEGSENHTADGEKIYLGNIYHMGSVEHTKVLLDVESLSAHVLITGSTGSGKSNTVYAILSELRKKGKKFLVIEPAKGEYKNVFGKESDVRVFGTNSRWSELLKINPFSFPEEIHVLEHIDRLIEIFNVCWPMYAAMPAVLKDAILRAYQCCGWDLVTSENQYGKRYYPTCMDLQKQIADVIHSSAYSEEVKGNYIGSLATRINSLTNGLNGRMFVSDEMDMETLFETNVIVDLSRVGSQETKSLIMGILVMKLNEYRMAKADGQMNQCLKHVTILEEAHNLLRDSSKSSASSEEGNLAGKSVEMISNSIAEMRTYGEGFIIVDQSPNAIDISAIRNTNTKILMRLPEESDRQQAGRAAAMTEKQIPELAKLPKGVAVVYQNDWLEPVLCKIQKADVKEERYQYQAADKNMDSKEKNIRRMIVMMLVGDRMNENLDIYVDDLRDNIKKIRMSTESRILIETSIDLLENGKMPDILKEEFFGSLSKVVCEVLGYDTFQFMINNISNVEELQRTIREILVNTIGAGSVEFEFTVSQCIMRKLASDDERKIGLYQQWREYAVEQMKQVKVC